MSTITPAAEHLSQALRFKTVSHKDMSNMDLSQFTAFEAFLEETYPLVHEKLEKMNISKHGLVFRWKGKDSGKRILLTAHYDVVPAGDSGWPFPPYSGHIEDGKIYGRGSLDDKGSLIGILEAVTALLEESYEPSIDIWFAFGFDEEVGGAHGAQKIAAYFQEQGLIFDYVLDEGGAVADGSMMGIEKPVAVIGVAEKGNTSFKLTFKGEPGHSSTPPKKTAIGEMGKFISAVEANPEKPRLTETLKAMLKAIAPYKKGIAGFVLAHPDIFAPVIIRILMGNRQTAAMLRTTYVFTMTEGGTAHNVLPHSAECTVNVRILQGDSPEAVLKRFEAIGIPFTAELLMGDEPTKASDVDSQGMNHLRTCIATVFPDAVITPYLMTGGTDCRHYDQVTKNAYRFSPFRVSEEELELIHGDGEYLSLENLQNMVEFYTLFLRGVS